ncbi:MAG: hypothetical protein QXI16_03170 [Sulfolobaceae archaeon]
MISLIGQLVSFITWGELVIVIDGIIQPLSVGDLIVFVMFVIIDIVFFNIIKEGLDV